MSTLAKDVLMLEHTLRAPTSLGLPLDSFNLPILDQLNNSNRHSRTSQDSKETITTNGSSFDESASVSSLPSTSSTIDAHPRPKNGTGSIHHDPIPNKNTPNKEDVVWTILTREKRESKEEEPEEVETNKNGAS